MPKRWIVVAVIALWGLVVLGLGYYSLRTDRPTGREQTTVSDALPTVDDALADAAAALDPRGTVVAVGGYVPVGGSCRITAARDGSRYQRILTAYTKEGAEGDLLDRLRAGLPTRYHARVLGGVLTADAGNFVAVRAAVAPPGQLRISADTGCRQRDAKLVGAEVASQPAGSRAAAQAVLDALALTGAGAHWRGYRLRCPGGGELVTVEAVAGRGPAPLPDALRGVSAGGEVVLTRAEVYAFRSGATGVAVRSGDAGVTVTATELVGCP